MNSRWHQQEVTLRGVGIGEHEEQIYVRLLVVGSASTQDVATEVGQTESTVKAALDRLKNLGLVTEGGNDEYSVVPPDVGIGALLVERHTELQQVQSRLAELLTIYRSGAGQAAGQVEPVTTQEQLWHWLDSLERAARQEILIMFRPPYMFKTDLDVAAAPRHVPYRILFDRSTLEQPGAAEELAAFAKSTDVRIAADIPSKMQIFDGRTALVPMVPDQAGMQPGWVLVRGQNLVRTLTTLFDRCWELSTPVRLSADGLTEGNQSGLDDVDIRLLTLMLSGAPDKTVAARMGTSERTVQRRIRRIMELTGTSSRMQLGWFTAKSELLANRTEQ